VVRPVRPVPGLPRLGPQPAPPIHKPDHRRGGPRGARPVRPAAWLQFCRHPPSPPGRHRVLLAGQLVGCLEAPWPAACAPSCTGVWSAGRGGLRQSLQFGSGLRPGAAGLGSGL